ncbi:28131_t:CDS:2 [Gigaspora margarita]|uniref:28131_t:CDS:1 n=1 Tax=Gigaspora margarita TaxID=4874 RepID=A0ABN7WM97_GIGMA|nr:28131_t:CDS:2 [Gigaspora margarita]
MRNTLSLVEFERLWDSLLENYPDSVPYLTELQFTQRVEGQNTIIKSIINSHTSIIELFKKLDAHFISWIVDYLTPAALFIQRQEIAQAIWYTSKLVNKDNALEIEYEDKSPSTSFAENTVDIPLILLKELIPANHYDDVIEIWELVLEPISTLQQQFFTDGFQESFATNLDEVFLEIPYKIPDISYEHVHKSLNQQKEYVKANRLSKKAIQMGLDAGPLALQEFNDFIENFIKRHTLKRVSGQELTHKNVKKERYWLNDFENPDSDYTNELSYQNYDDIKNLDPSLI